MRNREKGFTLFELMVTLIIIAIGATLAVPSYSDFLSRSKITGAATKIKADMEWARTTAIRDDRDIVMTIVANGAGNWCYGFDDGQLNAACDCTLTDDSAAACTVNGINRQNDQSGYGDTTVNDNALNSITFTSRGLTNDVGIINLEIADSSAQITTTRMGRSNICSNNLSQFIDC